MAVTKKQPYERYFIHGDFTDVMATGETIITGVITAIDKDGTDATADVIEAGTDYAEGPLYYFRIVDGLEIQSPYKFTLRIETSLGNRWEIDGGIEVVER